MTRAETGVARPPFRISECSMRGRRKMLEDAACSLLMGTSGPVQDWIPIVIALDGVGGHHGGDIAAKRALRDIVMRLSTWAASHLADRQLRTDSQDDILEVLRNTVQAANEHVLAIASSTPGLKGMASTVVCGMVVEGMLHLGWAGDSRCYVFRDGALRQLTEDHSLTADLIRMGTLRPEEAREHPSAHTITRYLGDPRGVDVDTRTFELQARDLVLMFTDGVTDVLSDVAITECLVGYREGRVCFHTLSKRLAVQALRAGTLDNVTVLCCEYDESRTKHRMCTQPTPATAVPLHLIAALRMKKENGYVRNTSSPTCSTHACR